MNIAAYQKHKRVFDSHLRELANAGGVGYYHPEDDLPSVMHFRALLEIGLVQKVEMPFQEAFCITDRGLAALVGQAIEIDVDHEAPARPLVVGAYRVTRTHR